MTRVLTVAAALMRLACLLEVVQGDDDSSMDEGMFLTIEQESHLRSSSYSKRSRSSGLTLSIGDFEAGLTSSSDGKTFR